MHLSVWHSCCWYIWASIICCSYTSTSSCHFDSWELLTNNKCEVEQQHAKRTESMDTFTVFQIFFCVACPVSTTGYYSANKLVFPFQFICKSDTICRDFHSILMMKSYNVCVYCCQILQLLNCDFTTVCCLLRPLLHFWEINLFLWISSRWSCHVAGGFCL